MFASLLCIQSGSPYQFRHHGLPPASPAWSGGGPRLRSPSTEPGYSASISLELYSHVSDDADRAASDRLDATFRAARVHETLLWTNEE